MIFIVIILFINFDTMQTNTYQVAIVTDHLKTYPLFTYVCGQMEWTATRSGKHAVVGYNGRGDVYHNHPASGFRFIVDEIACNQRISASRKRQIQTPASTTNTSFGAYSVSGESGVGGTPNPNFITCLTFINEYDAQEFEPFRNKLMDAHRMISPCPPTTSQAARDYRFFQQPNTTDCYISILSEGVTSQSTFCQNPASNPFIGQNPGGPSYSFTRQCCYSMG